METKMAKEQIIVKVARKLLWMKKNQPAKYLILSTITDGMVLGTWIFLSTGFALWMVNNGYCAFDSAMMALVLVDLNILFFDLTMNND
ncbi:hypothetical protein [Butyrivibrio sp. AC2005]|uniref:hypothetical protein n=1 Tax=Butyrivibrio sp. AC2005 TaxID=1280672 RepID=UPI00041CD9B9|nr:hypothetical protein [Butyrivibrio sp. AC2005]